MQKFVSFPFKEDLETGFRQPAHLNNPQHPDLRKETLLEGVNNYLKSPEEMEAEFNLIAQTEATDPLDAMVVIRTKTDELFLSSNNFSLGLNSSMLALVPTQMRS